MWGEGYCYVIEGRGPLWGYYKIGKSNNPHRRLKTIQGCNPFPLALVATFCGGETTERILHEHFADERTTHFLEGGTEWFYDGDVTRWVDALRGLAREWGHLPGVGLDGDLPCEPGCDECSRMMGPGSKSGHEVLAHAARMSVVSGWRCEAMVDPTAGAVLAQMVLRGEETLSQVQPDGDAVPTVLDSLARVRALGDARMAQKDE